MKEHFQYIIQILNIYVLSYVLRCIKLEFYNKNNFKDNNSKVDIHNSTDKNIIDNNINNSYNNTLFNNMPKMRNPTEINTLIIQFALLNM